MREDLLSTDYTPRHGVTRTRGRRMPSAAAMKRPVVGSGIAVALVASVGAAVGTGETPATAAPQSDVALTGRAAPVGDAFTALTDSTGSADAQRLADERRSAAASRSESREQERIAEAKKAKEQAAAKKKAAAQKALAKRKAAAKAKTDRLKAVQANPKPYAIEIMRDHGFSDDQWGCLQSLWIGESDFEWDATNASSGAYGIPQSLPAEKMATAGPDWRTNPETQMRWGMKYIKDAYGSPCAAYQFWSNNDPHWY